MRRVSIGPQIDTLRIYQDGNTEQTTRLLRLAQPTLRQFIAADIGSWDFVLSGPVLRRAIRWNPNYWQTSALRAQFYIAELKGDEDAKEEGEEEEEGTASDTESPKAKGETWTLQQHHEVSFGGQRADDRRPLIEAFTGLEQPNDMPYFPSFVNMLVAVQRSPAVTGIEI